MGTCCHGICSNLKKQQGEKRPKILPYLTHRQCRVCNVWFDRKVFKKARCPCCSTILAILPRENHKKRVYRMLKNERT